MATRPRVLLVDDHPGILKALARVLAPECDVVGQSPTAARCRSRRAAASGRDRGGSEPAERQRAGSLPSDHAAQPAGESDRDHRACPTMTSGMRRWRLAHQASSTSPRHASWSSRCNRCGPNSKSSTGFYGVLRGSTGFYEVLRGSTRFCGVLKVLMCDLQQVFFRWRRRACSPPVCS